MKYCGNCGQQLADTDTVCPRCAAAQETTAGEQPKPTEQTEPAQAAQMPPQTPPYQSPYRASGYQQPYQTPYQQPYVQPYQQPAGERPVSIGAWIGYSLLCCIPVVGFIVLLVLAFSGGTTPSLKNWARAALILMLIAVILIVFLALVGALGARTLMSHYYY